MHCCVYLLGALGALLYVPMPDCSYTVFVYLRFQRRERWIAGQRSRLIRLGLRHGGGLRPGVPLRRRTIRQRFQRLRKPEPPRTFPPVRLRLPPPATRHLCYKTPCGQLREQRARKIHNRARRERREKRCLQLFARLEIDARPLAGRVLHHRKHMSQREHFR